MSMHHRLPVSSRNVSVGWAMQWHEFSGGYPSPAALAVSFSLGVGGVPSTYAAGRWETDTSTDPDTYWAVLDVSGTGTGGVNEYPAGTYRVWIRVVDGIRTMVEEVGQLTLY